LLFAPGSTRGITGGFTKGFAELTLGVLAYCGGSELALTLADLSALAGGTTTLGSTGTGLGVVDVGVGIATGSGTGGKESIGGGSGSEERSIGGSGKSGNGSALIGGKSK
jgi:hypothetical protein